MTSCQIHHFRPLFFFIPGLSFPPSHRHQLSHSIVVLCPSLFILFLTSIFFSPSFILITSSIHRLLYFICLSALPIYITSRYLISLYSHLHFEGRVSFFKLCFTFCTFLHFISFSVVLLLSFLVISLSRSLSNLRPSIETNLREWITRKWNLHGFDALRVVTNKQNLLCADCFLQASRW